MISDNKLLQLTNYTLSYLHQSIPEEDLISRYNITYNELQSLVPSMLRQYEDSLSPSLAVNIVLEYLRNN